MTLRERVRNMVFQIINDGKVLTVHTEVGDGLSKVIVDEEEMKKEGGENADELREIPVGDLR